SAQGRLLTDAETHHESEARAVVIAHGYWQRALGGADVLGRTLLVRGVPYTVVGVAPRGFTGAELDRVDAWLPITAWEGSINSGPSRFTNPGNYSFSLVARVR